METATLYFCYQCGRPTIDPHTDPMNGQDVCESCCPLCNGEIDDADVCQRCGLLISICGGETC